MKKLLSKFCIAIIAFFLIGADIRANAQNSINSLQFKHNSFQDKKIVVDVIATIEENANISEINASFLYPTDLLSFSSIQTYPEFKYFQANIISPGEIAIYITELYETTNEMKLATVTFDVISNGKALLKFKDEAKIIDSVTKQDIASEKENGLYTIDENLSTLPLTGSNSADSSYGFAMLSLFAMIILFIIFGFIVWGSIFILTKNHKK